MVEARSKHVTQLPWLQFSPVHFYLLGIILQHTHIEQLEVRLHTSFFFLDDGLIGLKWSLTLTSTLISPEILYTHDI